MRTKNHKICVAYFSAAAQIGGAERSLELLVCSLGCAVRPVVFTVSGEAASLFQSKGIKTIIWDGIGLNSRTLGAYLRQSIRIAWLLLQERVSIVHVNDLTFFCGCWLGATLAGCKIISHARAIYDADEFSRTDRVFIRLISKSVICISKSVLNNVLERIPGIQTSKLCIVPNAVDIDAFVKAATVSSLNRVSLGIPDSAFVIGIASRIAPDKGHEIFVKAASVLVRSIPETHFLVVGAKEWYGKREWYHRIEQLILEMGLSGKFTFTDHVQNVSLYMGLMNVLVLTAPQEAFGRVIIEAMALHKPVVAAKGGGVPEIIQHEETGLLFEPGDYQQLAGHIIRLHGAPQERERISECAFRKCTDSYSIQTQLKSILDVYKGVTNCSHER